MSKPDWCTQEVWERALAVQDKAIERCEAGKLAYRFPTCNGKSVLDEEIARALTEAERRSQQEIDRLRREIDHKQKVMSSQAEQWTRSMAEAKREGMEEAAALLRDHVTISNGETLDPAIPEILKALYQKASDHRSCDDELIGAARQ